MPKDKNRPYKVKQCRGGKLGDYVWNGFTRHPEDKKFWAVRDVGDFGPSIEGKFKTLSDCCDAIDDWHIARDKIYTYTRCIKDVRNKGEYYE